MKEIKNTTAKDLKKERNRDFKAALLILLACLPLILIVIFGLSFNKTKKGSTVYVDPNYDTAFGGVRALEANSYGTEGTDYTADLGYKIRTRTDGTTTYYEAVVDQGTNTAFDSGTVTIPTYYNDGTSSQNYTVIGVDYSGFANSSALSRVIFKTPANITLIDAQAFACCSSLYMFNSTTSGNFNIPLNLTKISDDCFLNDISLKRLIFDGKNVTEIGKNAFNGCLGLTYNIIFKAGANGLILDESCFANCLYLKGFAMPLNVTEIKEYAFYDDRSMTVITIPSTVTSIGTNAFRLCTSARAMIGSTSRYPDGWPSDGADSGNDVIGTGSVTVADWNYASNGYAIPITTGLDDVRIDASGTYQYSAAFDTTYNIWKITIISYLLNSSATVNIPQTMQIDGDDSYTTITVDNSQIGIVVALADSSFKDHTELTTVTIPNTVDSIGQYAFQNDTKIKTLTFGDKKSNTTMTNVLEADSSTPVSSVSFVVPPASGTGSSTTVSSLSLGDYGLGTNYLTIGDFAFASACNSVTSLTIPAGTLSIGNSAFSNVLTMSKINGTSIYNTVNKGNTSLNNLTTLVFAGASDGTSELKTIGYGAFFGAGQTWKNSGGGWTKNVSQTCDLVLPNSLYTEDYTTSSAIGDLAFQHCSFLKSVTIKDATAVSSGNAGCGIGSYVFAYDAYLQYLRLGNNVKSVGRGLLDTDIACDWVYLDSGIVSYGDYLFYKCPQNCIIYCGAASVTGTVWNILNDQSALINYNSCNADIPGGTGVGTDVNTPAKVNFTSFITYYDVPLETTDTTVTTNKALITDTANKVQYLISNSGTVTRKITNYLGYLNGSATSLSLTSISNLTVIGKYSFLLEGTLTSILLPKTVPTIEEGAFLRASKLQYVGMTAATGDLPTSLTTIGDYAFCATVIKKVAIPASVTSIGTSAFLNCGTGFTSLTVATGNTTYKQHDETNKVALYKINSTGNYTLLRIISGATGTFTVMSGTTEIATNAGTCTGISGLVIPYTVKQIDYDAFHFKTVPTNNIAAALTSVSFTSTSANKSKLTTIGIGAFGDQTAITDIAFPANSTTSNIDIGNYAFHNCSGLTNFSFGAFTSIHQITNTSYTVSTDSAMPSGIFDNCSALTSLTIPAGVKIINVYAFYNCQALTSITFPSTVTTIDDYAFADCGGLTSVTFPANLTTLGDNSFENDTGIKTIDLSPCTSLTTSGLQTAIFSNCSSVEKVIYSTNLTTIPDSIFSYMTSLSSITNIGNVTAIGNNAFAGDSSLTYINLPSGLTSIGYNAFWSSGVVETTQDSGIFVLPNSVSTLGTNAFSSCSGLLKFQIGTLQGTSQLTSIPGDCFLSDANLTDIYFDSGTNLTSIETGAFQSSGIVRTSSGVDSFVLPNSVTILGASAFASCAGLVKFKVGVTAGSASLATISDNCFQSDSNLTDFYFDTGTALKTISSYAFDGCSSLARSTTSTGATGEAYFAIPSGVTEIQTFAFQNCTSLVSFFIPTTVTTVGVKAFYGVTPYTNATTPYFKIYTSLTFTLYNARYNNSGWVPDWHTLASGSCPLYCYSDTTPTATDTSYVTAGLLSGYWYYNNSGVITKYA
jgi:hypothetical protein